MRQQALTLPAHTIPALPADLKTPSPSPADAYLATLTTEAGRIGMRSALNQVAQILGRPSAADTPWHALRAAHVDALRAALLARPGRNGLPAAPASVNKALSAVRGVLKAAWRMGMIDTDSYHRAIDVPNVRGSRLPPGRALETAEQRALFAACTGAAAGARDAVAFALMFGAGLRRAEAVSVQLADYDADTGAITVNGKGNKQRLVYATNGGKDAIDYWLSLRGLHPGPLLNPIKKSGEILPGGMSTQALMKRLTVRAKQANIKHCSPHDLRRTFVSELLEAGADISAVQQLAGHASPVTTARYDRRGEATKRRAAGMLHVPFKRPA